jgi:hypothetical protein
LCDGGTSQLRVKNARRAAIVFGAYESVRQRGRVELPPTGVDDHPLETMVEDGWLAPTAGST